MPSPLRVVAIEMLVDDLDRAVELFVDVVGCELIARGPSPSIAGEVATVDGGSIIINLVHPATSGEGRILADREPRLSQLILGSVDEATLAGAHARAIARGLSVAELGDGNFHATPESVKGALGLAAAIVVTSLDGS
jgi:hypothetical protein